MRADWRTSMPAARGWSSATTTSPRGCRALGRPDGGPYGTRADLTVGPYVRMLGRPSGNPYVGADLQVGPRSSRRATASPCVDASGSVRRWVAAECGDHGMMIRHLAESGQ